MMLALVFAATMCAPPAPAAPPRDSWFGTDKVKHFFMSAFVQSAVFSASRAAGTSRPNAQRIASVSTVVAGVGREVHDKRRGRPFSLRDLAWDAAGGATAASVLRRTR